MCSLFVKVKKIHKRAFYGEDIHIDIPSGNVSEVVFKPSTNESTEVVILRAGQVVNSRGSINSLGYLVLEDVQENDEGEYIVKNTSNPIAVKCIILLVRGKIPPVQTTPRIKAAYLKLYSRESPIYTSGQIISVCQGIYTQKMFFFTLFFIEFVSQLTNKTTTQKS